MPQELRQTQTQAQKQQQVQRLSAQQMLQVKLLEMPLTQLEESVVAELDDNPALESLAADDALEAGPGDQAPGEGEAAPDETFEQQSEREEREDALDKALESMGQDDEMPQADTARMWGDTLAADYEEMVYGDTTSFYDKLREQMGELDLSETDRQVMDYLIGSLDDDGLLRKDTATIADELAVYHNLDVDAGQVERVLTQLQDFDPAGIGARSLQECLLLQVARREGSLEKRMMEELLRHHFDAFTKKHWHRIAQSMGLSEEQAMHLRQEIRKLNPKPGAALGETLGRSTGQITPDFLVETTDDGQVTFSLNRGRLPELHVSESFTDLVKTYQQNKKSMSRQEKEALLYAKEKVDKAQGFIEAVRQRRQTMYKTMKAIIELQHPFFADGDETELRPMILEDVAGRAGLDISTVSRVTGVKYAQTRWGTFPLRFFFSNSYTNDEGEELSTRKLKLALKELIESEDKRKPLSDDALTSLMNQRGYSIARRTVAKYREQLGLPVARLRKE